MSLILGSFVANANSSCTNSSCTSSVGTTLISPSWFFPDTAALDYALNKVLSACAYYNSHRVKVRIGLISFWNVIKIENIPYEVELVA